MRSDFYTVINGKHASVYFISSGCGSADYGVKGCRDLFSKPPTRVRIMDDNTWRTMCHDDAGFTRDEVIELVIKFKQAEHQEYLEWHEANKEKLSLGDPEPMPTLPMHDKQAECIEHSGFACDYCGGKATATQLNQFMPVLCCQACISLPIESEVAQ